VTYRPRLSRAERDRVLEVAERLNGAGGLRFHRALGILCRYFDVVQDQVSACPRCGVESINSEASGDAGTRNRAPLPEGRWWCFRCRDSFGVWDYLDVDDRERAAFPGLPDDLRYTFEADSTGGDDSRTEIATATDSGPTAATGGTIIRESGQDADSTGTGGERDPWEEGW
jgi:hypothetical protein